MSLSSGGLSNVLPFVEEKWHSTNQSNAFRVRIHAHWHCGTEACVTISDFCSDFIP